MFNLRKETSKEWAPKVLKNFNHFLIDHASCEKKAVHTALSIVQGNPDKPKLIDPIIGLAREELAHFHQVFRLLRKRNLNLTKDKKDPYIVQILSEVDLATKSNALLDRLIVFGVVEARGCERFDLLSEELEDQDLKKFYQSLSKDEEKHQALFLRVASYYFEDSKIQDRLNFFLDLEQKVLDRLPLKARLH